MWLSLALALQTLGAESDLIVVRPPDGGELRYRRIEVGDADYPGGAKRLGIEGTSDIVITIAPDGTMSDCRMLQSSGNVELDQKACALYRERARFQLSGRTTPLIVRALVQWRLQED